ncbi:MAG: CHAD domain-containing protein [Bryobacterales bacterium]|nr:CHAD domain-containing protein [Bryobacterales bacterium]
MKHRNIRWQPDAEVADNLREALPQMAKHYFRAGRKAAKKKAAAEDLHQFRLRTKHFRYLLEFFAPFYGRRLTRPMDSLRHMQTLLGELNDYAVTRAMLRSEPETAKLMSHLDTLETARRHEFRAYWREIFDKEGQQERWMALLSAPGQPRIS